MRLWKGGSSLAQEPSLPVAASSRSGVGPGCVHERVPNLRRVPLQLEAVLARPGAEEHRVAGEVERVIRAGDVDADLARRGCRVLRRPGAARVRIGRGRRRLPTGVLRRQRDAVLGPESLSPRSAQEPTCNGIRSKSRAAGQPTGDWRRSTPQWWGEGRPAWLQIRTPRGAALAGHRGSLQPFAPDCRVSSRKRAERPRSVEAP